MTLAHSTISIPNNSNQQPGFLFLGNDRCLDFLNTQMVVRGTLVDVLQSLEDLLRWLTEAGIVTAEQSIELAARWSGSAEGRAALEAAQALRSRLLAMVDHLIAGLPPTAESIDAINAILREQSGYQQVVPLATEGRERAGAQFWVLQRAYTFRVPNELLAPIAQAAATLVCEREWARIKRCENPTCILHFYDGSKNGSRCWCDTRTCGNRVRVAHHYQRRHASHAD